MIFHALYGATLGKPHANWGVIENPQSGACPASHYFFSKNPALILPTPVSGGIRGGGCGAQVDTLGLSAVGRLSDANRAAGDVCRQRDNARRFCKEGQKGRALYKLGKEGCEVMLHDVNVIRRCFVRSGPSPRNALCWGRLFRVGTGKAVSG